MNELRYILKYFILHNRHRIHLNPLSQVKKADAVVLLGAGPAEVPPTWLKPGAAVIRCDSALTSGSAKGPCVNTNNNNSVSLVTCHQTEGRCNQPFLLFCFVDPDDHDAERTSQNGLAHLTAAYRMQACLTHSAPDQSMIAY